MILNNIWWILKIKSYTITDVYLYSRWQIKYLRVATRFGLLAEVCLALLLLPILRVLPIFQLIGIQFEASVRYHILLGTSMIFFATIHGASTLFIWGVSHHVQDEVLDFLSAFPLETRFVVCFTGSICICD